MQVDQRFGDLAEKDELSSPAPAHDLIHATSQGTQGAHFKEEAHVGRRNAQAQELDNVWMRQAAE